MTTRRRPKWIEVAVKGAAITDIVLGVLLIAAPGWFSPASAQNDFGEMVVQSLGAGLIGVGLALAFSMLDYLRYWPLVAVGLVGNLPGLAALYYLAQHQGDGGVGALWPVGLRAVWSIPLALVLRDVWKRVRSAGGAIPNIDPDYLRGYFEMATTQRGYSLAELSEEHPVLLVMLRHAGCTFCRETLSDLNKQRRAIERTGVKIVIAHLSPESDIVEVCERYGVDDLDRIEDPDADLYRALGLERGSFKALFGPFMWIRGAIAGIFEGHGLGALSGDSLRMPGVFVVYQSQVVRSFRHGSVADRPDYVRLATVGVR